MLEIGCGKGVVVEYLRGRGMDCFGVEVAPTAPLASVAPHITTGTDFASLDDTFRRSIDTVLLFDVIEHVSDDVAFMTSVRLAFPNLKRIIATVPARMELWSNYDEYNGHFRRYSMKTLEQLSDKLHVSSRHFSYFFHSLYLPARLSLFWSRRRSTHIVAPHGRRIRLHAWLAKFFVLDFLLLPEQIPGTSIVCSFDVNHGASSIRR